VKGSGDGAEAPTQPQQVTGRTIDAEVKKESSTKA
jgi:hypothetical protein